MKSIQLILILCIALPQAQAQTVVINQTPCTDKDVQTLPALYYNHTQPKYGRILEGTKVGFTAADEAKIITTLNSIEKLEENSRNNFQATGCVMRVSYSRLGKNFFSGFLHAGYEYQLGLYQMVCHVQQHVVKEVGEYRSVLRIGANPTLTQGGFYSESGDFYITDKTVRYNIPTDAKWGATYDKDRFNNRSRMMQFITADMLLQGKSDDKSDFDKLNNGEGYADSWEQGDKKSGYQWIRRTWLITQKGIPLLVPVTRKEFLAALLEYYEIEQFNFQKAAALKTQSDKSKIATIEADKAAYNQIYETKKARISNLLKTKGADWLGKQVAVTSRFVRENDYAKASNGLFDIYDFENGIPLYQYNPTYFKTNANNPLKPILFKVVFRFEKDKSGERQWSENLMNNFMKSFDFNALQKMMD